MTLKRAVRRKAAVTPETSPSNRFRYLDASEQQADEPHESSRLLHLQFSISFAIPPIFFVSPLNRLFAASFLFGAIETSIPPNERCRWVTMLPTVVMTVVGGGAGESSCRAVQRFDLFGTLDP
ncbi:hypothetical protein E2C01_023829 [Portunus trituberculatus]|uniref:Uncharacterized protein n=1 Tax=Portunus trituberculatus TaxID=210409 RepID=A0A5B7E970_PORTR|nr:hypothetical protein [Portunus trituberculatus]